MRMTSTWRRPLSRPPPPLAGAGALADDAVAGVARAAQYSMAATPSGSATSPLAPAAGSGAGSGRADATPALAVWGVAGWLRSLQLTEIVAEALCGPVGADPFVHVLGLSRADLEGMHPRIRDARIDHGAKEVPTQTCGRKACHFCEMGIEL